MDGAETCNKVEHKSATRPKRAILGIQRLFLAVALSSSKSAIKTMDSVELILQSDGGRVDSVRSGRVN